MKKVMDDSLLMKLPCLKVWVLLFRTFMWPMRSIKLHPDAYLSSDHFGGKNSCLPDNIPMRVHLPGLSEVS